MPGHNLRKRYVTEPTIAVISQVVGIQLHYFIKSHVTFHHLSYYYANTMQGFYKANIGPVSTYDMTTCFQEEINSKNFPNKY